MSNWDFKMKYDTGDSFMTVYYKAISLDREDKLFWFATVKPVMRRCVGLTHYPESAKELTYCFPKNEQVGEENDPLPMPKFLQRLKHITQVEE